MGLLAVLALVMPGAVMAPQDAETAALQALLRDGFYLRAASRAQRLFEDRGEPDDLAGAELLDVLTEGLRRGGGDRDAVRKAAERALECKRKLGAEPADLAQSLHNLGVLEFMTGKSEAAALLAAAEAAWPAAHCGKARTLVYLAMLRLGQRDLDGAAAAFAQARAIQDAGTPDAADRAFCIHYQATLHERRGDIALAQRTVQEAIAVAAHWLRADHPQLLNSLHNLARLHLEQGDLARALEVQRGVVAKMTTGEEVSAGVAAQAHFLAARLACDLGDLDGGEASARQALKCWEQGGETAGDFAACSRLLAIVLWETGRREAAAVVLERAVTAAGQTLDRALLAEVRGDEATAAEQYAKAVETMAGTPQEQSRVLVTLGGLQGSARQWQAAQATFSRALQVSLVAYGERHPTIARIRVMQACLQFDRGDLEAAYAGARAGEDVGRDHLLATATALPERRGLDYAFARTTGLGLMMSVVLLAPQRAEDALDTVVRSRGLLFDMQRQRVRAAAGSESSPLLCELERARAALARIAFEQERPELKARLHAAFERREAAEQALIKAGGDFAAGRELYEAGLAEVKAALPEGAVLVSCVRFARREPGGACPHFVAFVVKQGKGTEVVPLGPARAIDAAVGEWHRALRSDTEVLIAGAQLRRLLWDPLAAYLAGASLVLWVPDGELHRVNPAALYSDDGTFLVETGPPVQLMTAERDVLSCHGPKADGKGLLIVGDPDPDAGVAASARLRSYGRLPGAESESAALAKLWQQLRPGAPLRQLRGAAATESAVRAQAPGCEVLHLALHGFFRGSVVSAAAGQRGRDPDSSTASAPSASSLAPLLRSGLVLSGGNGAPPLDPLQDDGILTAEEILGLDLRGTGWVVLSACDSARGELRQLEGVHGLRRALLLAGARTVIASLWPVDDDATREWMEQLYRLRLQGASTAVAMQRSSRAWLEARRAAQRSTNPRLWAAFVATGDWR